MSSLPEIKNQKYHEMSFSEIDAIREKLCSGEWGLYIKRTQSMLYLNQMAHKYSFRLKMVQNISIISLIATIVFLFINWKITPLLFIIGIASGVWVSKKSLEYIGKNCQEDRVFLKFALAVGLVELQKPETKI